MMETGRQSCDNVACGARSLHRPTSHKPHTLYKRIYTPLEDETHKTYDPTMPFM